MPYLIEVASVHRQFNKVSYEFNLIDSDGILPPTRRAYNTSQDTTDEEMDLIKAQIIQEETVKSQEIMDYESNKDFMRQFIPLVDSSLENLRVQLLSQILSQNELTPTQIKIANSVEFTWKLKDN